MEKKEEKPLPSPPKTTEAKRDIEELGKEAYAESAKALREVGTRVILAVVAAIIIWLAGRLIFVPLAEGLTNELFGYPIAAIVSTVIIIALAVIIFTVFVEIRRLTKALSGVLAYQFGKATGEIRTDDYNNYRIAMDGVLYVIIISLTYLLFVDYLADIHPAIPAIILILIVIWAIFALWRTTRAIANIIGRYTSKAADEIEKQAK